MKDMTNDNTALMQEMNQAIGQLVSGFTGVTNRLTRIDDRMTGVDDRLTGIDYKLTTMDDRLTGVEGRLTGINDRLAGMDSRLTGMDNRLTRLEVLHEETDSNVKAVLEVLADHGRQLAGLSSLTRDIPEMKADIKTIKATLTATNHQVANHEHRITKLESKAA